MQKKIFMVHYFRATNIYNGCISLNSFHGYWACSVSGSEIMKGVNFTPTYMEVNEIATLNCMSLDHSPLY